MTEFNALSENEQADLRFFWYAALCACVRYGGNIASCWSDMTDTVGRDIAWEIYDEARLIALKQGDAQMLAWAESISGERT